MLISRWCMSLSLSVRGWFRDNHYNYRWRDNGRSSSSNAQRCSSECPSWHLKVGLGSASRGDLILHSLDLSLILNNARDNQVVKRLSVCHLRDALTGRRENVAVFRSKHASVCASSSFPQET